MNYLIRGLSDESYINKINAAEAIVLIKYKNDLSSNLVNLIKYCPNPLTVAGAFHALIHGWLNHEEMDGFQDGEW
ncbi:hypothetical protein D3C76_1792990 [compost metagenome]